MLGISSRRWGLLCLLLALLCMAPSAGQAQTGQVQRVAILPFTANAKDDISFLVKGVRDMLASRLAWQDRVVVVEPDLIGPAMAKSKPPYTDDKARQMGKDLSAQVVVFGSITVLGQAVSVDARVVKVGDGGEPLTAFVQTADLDAVIPRVNDFATRINAEIFLRPDAVAAQKKTQGEAVRAITPSEAPADTAGASALDKLPDTMSPLNPLFMRTLTGVDSDRYWRSPRIEGSITSIAVGDIDGDGKNELLVLLPNSLRVYRLAGEHFALIREFKNGPNGTYLFVDVADIDGSGRPQIYVSNRYNKSLNSFVLQWGGEKGLQVVAKDLPYYFRVQPNPVGEGHLLLAQKTVIDEAFFGPVWQMKWQGKELVPAREIPMPFQGNVYNLCLADLNGSGKPMLVEVAHNYALKVFNSNNDVSWVSGESYGATGKYFELDALAGQGVETVWYYLPARLVLTDLDKDGRHEVVVVRNADRADGLLEKMRMFYQGTIYGLYWNGMQMVEQWRTPNISGYVTDYAIADVGNVGKPALVMAVSQREAQGFMEGGTSHVVAFTLKPQKAPTPAGGLK